MLDSLAIVLANARLSREGESMYRTQSVVELRKLVRDKGTGIPGTLIANAGLDDLATFLESTDKGGLDADGAGAAFATSVNARIAARPQKPKKKAKAKAKPVTAAKAPAGPGPSGADIIVEQMIEMAVAGKLTSADLEKIGQWLAIAVRVMSLKK